MQAGTIEIGRKRLDDMKKHLLLENGGEYEEAAFLFCSNGDNYGSPCFRVEDCWMLSPADFASRSKYFLELKDETRRAIVKRAHGSGWSVVEVHSHPGQKQAKFSPSDLAGFQDFVPHMLWRLQGRPYAAVVFGESNFDSLVWSNSAEPDGWCSFSPDGKVELPTKHSFVGLGEKRLTFDG